MYLQIVFFLNQKWTLQFYILNQIKNYYLKLKNIENLEKITNIFFSNKRKMINKSY